MIATLLQARHVFSRKGRRDPERLWVHYCLAVVIFLGLLVSMYLLHRAASQEEVALARTIDISNQQQIEAARVVQTARSFADGDAESKAALADAIAALTVVHTTLAGNGTRTDALQEHFYGSADPLNAKMRHFLTLARLVANGASSRRMETFARLEALFEDGGLQRDINAATTLFSAALRNDARQKLHQQSLILVAATVVIVLEAGLIFLPAQRAVQVSFQTLRRQTLDLQASRQKLREMNNRLSHMVSHDQLTGLPNRTGFANYMSNGQASKSVQDHALLLVGLDDFKAINDMLGPEIGDALLMAVGRSLTSCVNHDDHVARVGSDEFVIVGYETPEILADRILTSLRHPFQINGRRINITGSIGHLCLDGEDRPPLDIVADAAVALRFAKADGGDMAYAFTAKMRTELEQFQQMQVELRDALRNGEIEPWFQPQVRLSDGTLHGAEVLARWRHPKRGLLSPHEFLPAVEGAGLMVELDHAVWSAALRYARGWQEESIWRPCISLNASPATISDPNLLERFLLTLRRLGIDADQVVVEVLETTLISGKDDMAAINIDSLAESGIALELDDFGTGYASLSRLTQLPLRGIKLDRSLVSPLPDQSADSVVRAILALAGELGLQVVAEGVEYESQASHLTQRGCAIGQGFGFAKPMSPSDFQAWLSVHAGRAVKLRPVLSAAG